MVEFRQDRKPVCSVARICASRCQLGRWQSHRMIELEPNNELRTQRVVVRSKGRKFARTQLATEAILQKTPESSHNALHFEISQHRPAIVADFRAIPFSPRERAIPVDCMRSEAELEPSGLHWRLCEQTRRTRRCDQVTIAVLDFGLKLSSLLMRMHRCISQLNRSGCCCCELIK